MDPPRYRIEIFCSDEDGGYIANVPDLQYCSAFGESYEEALREVLVAMELHLDTLKEEGRPIPEPAAYREFEIGAVAAGSGHAVEQIIVADDEHVSEYDPDMLARSVSEILEATLEATVQGLEEETSLEEAHESVGSPSGIDLAVLTHSQRQVLEMAARGFNTQQIARNLHLSTSIIKHQMQSASRALGAARAVNEAALRVLRRSRSQ